MDLEERLSQLIGTQFITILKLQAQIEVLAAENDSLKAPREPTEHAPDAKE